MDDVFLEGLYACAAAGDADPLFDYIDKLPSLDQQIMAVREAVRALSLRDASVVSIATNQRFNQFLDRALPRLRELYRDGRL